MNPDSWVALEEPKPAKPAFERPVPVK